MQINIIYALKFHNVPRDHHGMEKPIDFWLRKGKAVGETKPTENSREHPKQSITT